MRIDAIMLVIAWVEIGRLKERRIGKSTIEISYIGDTETGSRLEKTYQTWLLDPSIESGFVWLFST